MEGSFLDVNNKLHLSLDKEKIYVIMALTSTEYKVNKIAKKILSVHITKYATSLYFVFYVSTFIVDFFFV